MTRGNGKWFGFNGFFALIALPLLPLVFLVGLILWQAFIKWAVRSPDMFR